MSGTVSLPTSARPLVSILVIAWRRADGLLRCLAALAASPSRHRYEVIVILNGATAAVREALTTVSGIRTVDLEENVGFGGGMNRGSRVARGRYLALLNDDVEVEAGWLDALVDVAERHGRSVGAVGSLLLNLDGTVQEAGSRVLSGAGTVQQGAGLSPAAAEAAGFAIEREIDYCSAAAVLIPRRVFRAFEGFDPRYEPAYYEDVDLEWRIRRSGRRILLAPGARACHLSGASTSKDPLFREWAASRSGARFIERWSAALATTAAEDAPPDVLGSIPTHHRWRRSRSLASRLSNLITGRNRDRRQASQIALGVSRDYAAWLETELASARSEESFRELARLRHEMHTTFLRNQELEARMAGLESTAEDV